MGEEGLSPKCQSTCNYFPAKVSKYVFLILFGDKPCYPSTENLSPQTRTSNTANVYIHNSQQQKLLLHDKNVGEIN